MLCSQFVLHLSRQVALYLPALEWNLWNLDSESEEFLDKVSVLNRTQDVDCEKRFPVFQTNSMYQTARFGRGLTQIEHLERLPVDWEREKKFHCNSILSLEILLHHLTSVRASPGFLSQARARSF